LGEERTKRILRQGLTQEGGGVYEKEKGGGRFSNSTSRAKDNYISACGVSFTGDLVSSGVADSFFLNTGTFKK